MWIKTKYFYMYKHFYKKIDKIKFLLLKNMYKNYF